MESFIATSIKIKPPQGIAVPVCADWAQRAQELRQDPNDEEIKEAKQILAFYPESQPRGQGEVDLSPQDLAATLQQISAMTKLEERYNIGAC